MTRHDLVGLTLDQLLNNFASGPECFDLEVAEAKSFSAGPSDAIMWKHKIENGDIIQDPTQPMRTVIIVNNKATETIQCFIHFRDMISATNAMNHKPDAQVESKAVGFFRKWDSNYRKFEKLKRLIQQNNAARENTSFLNKLHTVFPGCWDEYIFGKK